MGGESCFLGQVQPRMPLQQWEGALQGFSTYLSPPSVRGPESKCTGYTILSQHCPYIHRFKTSLSRAGTPSSMLFQDSILVAKVLADTHSSVPGRKRVALIPSWLQLQQVVTQFILLVHSPQGFINIHSLGESIITG